MRVHLEYGRTGLDVELPDRHVVKCLGYRPAEPLADPAAAVRRVLWRSRSARRRWPNWPAAARNACVVICDITRPVPNE